MRRLLFEPEHELVRTTARSLFERHAVQHVARWEREGLVDRGFWLAAGRAGLLAFDVPEEYGGPGVRDFRYNTVVDEELLGVGAVGMGLPLQNDIVTPYLVDLTTSEQKARWLPGVASGEIVTAIAMSEPGTGSDLRGMTTSARRSGAGWVLRGSKTFVTNGVAADLVVVAAGTGEAGGRRRFSLFAVERGTPGFTRGHPLDKVGQHAQDTAELFFADVRLPAENLIGEEGEGLAHLMGNLPRERLSIAVMAVASAERALALTLDYCRQRRAFGQPVGSFQANRFSLAEMHTEVAVGRSHVDRCIAAVNAGELTPEEAAGVKYWTTDMQWRVLDRCVQLHGGYGYMNEYEIARLWRDGRVQRIYGGTNEIMKEVVGRGLGL